MQIVGIAHKVTIYIGESDKWGRKPLYMAILELLRKEDCAGATVTRAVAGFGAHSRIHTASLVDLSSDLPLVIEWVDSPARIKRVMPLLREMVSEGLITVQEVEVVTYSHRRLRDLPTRVPVQDIMQRELHTVPAEIPLAEAAELLLDKVYRTLLVVDGTGRLIGILTDGDLLNRANLLPPSAQRGLTRTELAGELQNLRQTGQTVGENMTSNPVTISGETTIPEAVKLMIERDVKRLPVIDKDNRLLGIVSRVDILRALSLPAVAEPPRQNPPPGYHVRVDEIMMTRVPTVHADASLAEVVELLVTSAQRRVVVVDDEERVAGIITDGDLIKRATPTERSGIIQSLSRRLPVGQDDSFHLSRRTAAEVMTKQVITVTPETSLSEALQLLLAHHIKRLPVVNATGQPIGLVGRGGILQVMAANTES